MDNLEFLKMMLVGVLGIGIPVLLGAGFLLWALGVILTSTGPCPWLP